MSDQDVMCGVCGTAMDSIDDGYNEAEPLCSEACWYAYRRQIDEDSQE